jgi:hypothetical protein
MVQDSPLVAAAQGHLPAAIEDDFGPGVVENLGFTKVSEGLKRKQAQDQQ